MAVYGSMATGLALETSDLDLAVCGLRVLDKGELLTALQKIRAALAGKDFLAECQVIETARVPVIKLVSGCMYMRIESGPVTSGQELVGAGRTGEADEGGHHD